MLKDKKKITGNIVFKRYSNFKEKKKKKNLKKIN